MTQALHPEWLDWPQTQALIAAFAHAKAELRFVGGAVRDAVLGKAVTDVDAATPLLPEAVMALLEKAGIKAIPTGIGHGTVTAVIDKKHFEITTLRRDIACDGRHADVAFTDDWQADAARRDFTFNALYLSPSGELFDYFGGVADAKAGHVRFIGEPLERINEDYLRILRFFRFTAWYGKEAPDEASISACAALATHMHALSGERLQAELFKLLAAPEPSGTLQLMHEQRILPHIIGFEVSGCEMFTRLEALEPLTGITLEPFIKLSGFVFSACAPLTYSEALDILAERLKLPAKMARELLNILRHHETIQAGMADAEQKRALRRWGAQRFKHIVLINWASSHDPIDAAHPYNRLLALAEHWRPPEFPVTGNDLIAQGIAPGKALGELLRTLEEEWEMSGYRLAKDQLLSKTKTC